MEKYSKEIREVVKDSLSSPRKSVEYAPLTSPSDLSLSQSNDTEKDVDMLQQPRRRKSMRSTTLILGVILMNIIYFVVVWSYRPTESNRLRSAADEIFPAAQYYRTKFYDDGIHPGPENDKKWSSQLPHGNGFIMVDDPDKYGLPEGAPQGSGTKKYGVTWAHQYHCVWMLKNEFWRFVNNESLLVGMDIDEKSQEGELLWHLAHCFGYLRDGIVCDMDMTLEYPTLGGANAGTINGYEVDRVCKKRDIYDDYTDKHAPDPAKKVVPHQKHHPHHADLVKEQ